MRSFSAAFTAILFFIWILPLGVFITPEQEAQACNGQRAICLCSHLMGQAQAPDDGKIVFQNTASSTNKENSSANSHYFLSALNPQNTSTCFAILHKNTQPAYARIILRAIEHVPKHASTVV